jgi:hypothetical protein
LLSSCALSKAEAQFKREPLALIDFTESRRTCLRRESVNLFLNAFLNVPQKTHQTFSPLRHLIDWSAQEIVQTSNQRAGESTMSQNPKSQETCEVRQQVFDSEQERQAHQNNAHGQNESGERQSNYDIETDRPNQRKIA